MTFQVRPVTADQWRLARQVRLAALQDSPAAFVETYPASVGRPDAFWRRRIAVNAERILSTCELAFCGEEPIGMAVGYRTDVDAVAVTLAAMWVAPAYRGSQAAVLLCDAVTDWARQVGANSLNLSVNTANARAIRFYERMGFTRLPGTFHEKDAAWDTCFRYRKSLHDRRTSKNRRMTC